MRLTELERFHSSYTISELTGCWEWNLSLDRDGYGSFRTGSTKTGRKLHRAHRWSFEKLVGFTNPKLQALHRCDNRKCVNPKHLFEGTHKDNMADMVSKGRSPTPKNQKGSGNRNAKLDEAAVIKIISLLPSMTNKEIALITGVSHDTISKIRLGKSWKHISR